MPHMFRLGVSRRHLITRGAGGVMLAPLASTMLAQAASAAIPADSAEAMIASLSDGIFINANENPYGPAPAAQKALAGLAPLSGRYGMSFAGRLAGLVCQQHGLPAGSVAIHPGSFAALRAVGLAYSSTAHPVAYFEPTFDSGFLGAGGKPVTRTVTLPLAGDFRMDLKKLLAAAPDAGVYYICNPNNPTGLITPRAEIEWLLANKPKGSVVLVDEAYLHYTSEPSCLDLVAKGADVIVLQTFSKIYGLAGLRVGLVAGRKDLLEPLEGLSGNIPPMPAVLAAEASLLDPTIVPARKAETARVRKALYAWLDARGMRYLPAEANFVMIEVGRPGGEVQAALAKQKIFTSGARKHMANWFRVSIGSAEEMAAFQTALGQVMGKA